MIFLGIDASSTMTGWSIIDASSYENMTLVDYGEIPLAKFKTKKNPIEYMLVLHKFISELLTKYNPNAVYIEDIYMRRNQVTFKTLARVRGACELTCLILGHKDFTAISTMEARRILGESKKKVKLDKPEVCTILENRFKKRLATEGYDQSDAILITVAGVKEYYERTNKKVKRNYKRRRRITK